MFWKYKFIKIKWEVWIFDFHENEVYIKEQKFITKWNLTYHLDAKNKAKMLRNNMTESEIKIWKWYLQKTNINVNRQKPIDHFIADFYVPSCKLVIEIDWSIHNLVEQNNYDKRRDDILKMYWIIIVRITNNNIKNYFDETMDELTDIIKYTQQQKLNLQ